MRKYLFYKSFVPSHTQEQLLEQGENKLNWVAHAAERAET